MQVFQDPTPSVARVVVGGKWQGDPYLARCILDEVDENFPDGIRVDYLTTCGGFLEFPWVDITNIGGVDPVLILTEFAYGTCARILTSSILRRLSAHARYLVMGVDSTSSDWNCHHLPHIELVATIDLDTGAYSWTGKSYPQKRQERGLVRIVDTTTHMQDLMIERVLVLGCHDLNMWNPHVTKVNPWRQAIKEDFFNHVDQFRPTTVIHLPNWTDSPGIWRQSMVNLMRMHPSVRRMVSNGLYHNPKNPIRSTVELTLAGTKIGCSSVDFYADGTIPAR